MTGGARNLTSESPAVRLLHLRRKLTVTRLPLTRNQVPCNLAGNQRRRRITGEHRAFPELPNSRDRGCRAIDFAWTAPADAADCGDMLPRRNVDDRQQGVALKVKSRGTLRQWPSETHSTRHGLHASVAVVASSCCSPVVSTSSGAASELRLRGRMETSAP